MKTALYRHLDANGVLLYVGIAACPVTRLSQHMAGSDWVESIASIEITWCADRKDALARESQAITTENPLFNRAPGRSVSKGPISDLINEWPHRALFARDVGAEVQAVHKWAQNGRIPSGWMHRVVEAAQSHGIEYVTAEWMLNAHQKQVAAT